MSSGGVEVIVAAIVTVGTVTAATVTAGLPILFRKYVGKPNGSGNLYQILDGHSRRLGRIEGHLGLDSPREVHEEVSV